MIIQAGSVWILDVHVGNISPDKIAQIAIVPDDSDAMENIAITNNNQLTAIIKPALDTILTIYLKMSEVVIVSDDRRFNYYTLMQIK